MKTLFTRLTVEGAIGLELYFRYSLSGQLDRD